MKCAQPADGSRIVRRSATEHALVPALDHASRISPA